MFIREKVGTFTAIKQLRNSRFRADEVFEIEVNQETLLETERTMQSNTSKFYEKFKGKVPKKHGVSE